LVYSFAILFGIACNLIGASCTMLFSFVSKKYSYLYVQVGDRQSKLQRQPRLFSLVKALCGHPSGKKNRTRAEKETALEHDQIEVICIYSSADSILSSTLYFIPRPVGVFYRSPLFLWRTLLPSLLGRNPVCSFLPILQRISTAERLV
jgi:hypothetical protein